MLGRDGGGGGGSSLHLLQPVQNCESYDRLHHDQLYDDNSSVLPLQSQVSSVIDSVNQLH